MIRRAAELAEDIRELRRSARERLERHAKAPPLNSERVRNQPVGRSTPPRLGHRPGGTSDQVRV
eukprot:5830756-Prymnesium_polylepis.3